MEETEISIRNTKVSDSGYSNSCSNSQSQRSGSSKSRHSGSSTGSSGYCGHPLTGSSNDSFQPPSAMKRKEYKKKKLKSMAGELLSDAINCVPSGTTAPLEPIPPVASSSPHSIIENTFLTSGNSQSNETENTQLAPLSRNTLSINCIKKLKGKDITSAGEVIDEGVSSPDDLDNKDDGRAVVENINKSSLSSKDEFSAVVSMEEGVVLYTTRSLTDILGYPKDMWLGRSLIDFVHPKDRKAFNSQIISAVSLNRCDQSGQLLNRKIPFYCCMRQYRGLKSSGFGVIDKKISYLPCQLALSFRDIPTKYPTVLAGECTNQKKNTIGNENMVRAVLLVITVRPVHSTYKVPDEMCATPTCTTTRHSTSMVFTHADPEVVSYFGYLPQDMLGQSVFDFYHPEDLPYLKEVYQMVFKDKGQPFRSKPYRFRTQNGGFCVIETEWSSFINPWSRKIEFITGKHNIIKGPPNPDVATPVGEAVPLQIPEDLVKKCKSIQDEIVNVLSETAVIQDSSKRQLTKYCKDILTYMENFVDDGKSEKNSKNSESKPVSLSISDRDSVMLGEISPHHEYYGSKSSSETPPSYTQLNYNDNIQRFFESKPKTTLSDESGDSKTSSCGEIVRNTQLSGAEEEGKISSPIDSSSGGSQNRNNESGGSSDLSYGCTSGRENKNNNSNSVSINNKVVSNSVKGSKYRTPHLTEELLFRHNEDMEKKMVQLHRERSKSDREHKLKDGRHKKNYDKILDEQNTHGVKRSGSHSWEGEPYKSIKQTHEHDDNELPANVNNVNNKNNNTTNCNNNSNISTVPKTFSLQTNSVGFTKTGMETSNNINLWPPFSVSVTPMHNTQPCAAPMTYSAASLAANAMMPVYYVSPEITSSNRTDHHATEHSPSITPYTQPQAPYVTGQFQYLSNMMYHPVTAATTGMPMFGMPPTVMYSPLTVLPTPLLAASPIKSTRPAQSQPPTTVCNDNDIKINSNPLPQMTQSSACRKLQRPASQATSVRAEPGSALCSVASLQQSIISNESSESLQEEAKQDINSNGVLDTAFQNDSSSYYSSFYSFIKTDEKSDESMKSLTENDSSVDTNTENKQEQAAFCMWRRKPSNNESNRTGCVQRQIRKVPPWLENISLTPELMYRYRVNEKELSDVLESDLKLLTEINQPLAVNDQLCQLYLDLDNYQHQDYLETSIGITSSSGTSSGEGDDYQLSVKMKKKYRTLAYSDKMAMMYEENAPMPSPLSCSNGAPTLLPV